MLYNTVIVLFRREILALQAENYALEKQLHSYQQSISRNHGKELPPARNHTDAWLQGGPTSATNSF